MHFTYPLPGLCPPPFCCLCSPQLGIGGTLGKGGTFQLGVSSPASGPREPCLACESSRSAVPTLGSCWHVGCQASGAKLPRETVTGTAVPRTALCLLSGGRPGVSAAVGGRVAGQSLTAKMQLFPRLRGQVDPWDLHSFASGQSWTTGCNSQKRTVAEVGRPFARTQGLRKQAAWRVCIIM